MTFDARDTYVRRLRYPELIASSREIKSFVMDLLELIKEEEEDDDLLLQYYLSLERASTNSIFLSRNEEGYYKILIQKHLNSDDEMFRDFCRFNKRQFKFILGVLNDELQPKTTRECINSEEKLFLTLR